MTNPTSRLALLLVLLSSLMTPLAAIADPRDALVVEDLAADGDRSRRLGVPIVVLMSASYCGYCDRVREEFFIPMVIGGDYAHRALLRELPIDGPMVRNFDGTNRPAGDIAERYRVSLVPVILFLDGEGRELTKRMVGLGTVDFFGAYLDAAIETAAANLAAGGRRP